MDRRTRVSLSALALTVVLAALALSAGGFSREDMAELSGQVAEVASTITGQTALLADAVSTGRHMGFDTVT